MFRRKQIERRRLGRAERYDAKRFMLYRMYTTDDEPDEVRELNGLELRDIDKLLREMGYTASGNPPNRWVNNQRETVYWAEPVESEVPYVPA